MSRKVFDDANKIRYPWYYSLGYVLSGICSVSFIALTWLNLLGLVEKNNTIPHAITFIFLATITGMIGYANEQK